MSDPEGRWKDGVEHNLDKHDERLSALEGFQKYLIGAVGLVMWIAGFMADKIKHALGF